MEEIELMQQDESFQRNHNQSMNQVDSTMCDNEVANNDDIKEEEQFELKGKAWIDINFSLWNTDSARLQYYCTCNAEAQMSIRAHMLQHVSISMCRQ